jgi:hypothetical protein
LKPARSLQKQKYGNDLQNELQNFGKKLQNSHIIGTAHPFMFDILEKGRSKSGDADGAGICCHDLQVTVSRQSVTAIHCDLNVTATRLLAN